MKRYEDSDDDKRKDKAGAKKAKLTMRAWERSDADRKADKMGQKKLDRKKK